MSILRCDGCGAKFPNTPEGHKKADRHIRDYHGNPLWSALFIFVFSILGGAFLALL